MSVSLESMRTLITTGFTAHTGIELTSVGEGFAEGKIELKPEHLNPYGVVHGGVTYCLADVLGGAAFRTMGGLPVTMNSNITYFRPVKAGKVIYAKAEVVRYGNTTSFIETKIFDEDMMECCRVAATYYNIEGRI